MINIIKHELSNNKKYLYLGILISTLTIIPQFIVSPSVEHSVLMLLTLILLCLLPKFSKIMFSVFIIFINASNIIIAHIAMHWGYNKADISPRIEVATLSPAYETVEYLSTYIDYKDYLVVLYSILVILLLYKFLKHYTHSYKILRPISISLSILIITAVSIYNNPIKKIEPFSIPNKYIEFIKNKKFEELYIQRKTYLQGNPNTQNINKDTIYEKVVIIMGESANKHHMQIYGYTKNTTPFLSSLKSINYTYLFNAIAPTNQTRFSVSIDLTKANVNNFLNLFLHSPSIISGFKSNGYKTHWLSNQGRIGEDDAYIPSIADEADTKTFTNLFFLTATTDNIILESLDEIKSNSKKEMFLIHLIGSHAKYTKRYTEDLALIKEANNFPDKYDNTIYYTDYILSKIYNKFKNKKLLLIYISDHGEIVNNDKHGHGFSPPFKDEYDVPFIIYSNVKNSRLDEIYKDNKSGYFNLENLNYIIEYVSGISDDKNISFSNQVFALEPTNIFNYDNLVFYK